VLFVADVVGRPGCRAVSGLLPTLRKVHGATFCVVNGENAADGAGITRSIVEEFFGAGADVITTGNHVWKHKDVLRCIDGEPRLLRPANLPAAAPGRGHGMFTTTRGTPILVLNLVGRVFMDPADCPFRTATEILAAHADRGVSIVDFHAEATSEKMALAWYLAGKASAVLGTHTHVTTADERVLPGGTAYLTDVGMTGPFDSIIGVRKEAVIRRMTTSLPTRFEVATGDVRLSGALVSIEAATGCARAIERLQAGLPT
jgi:metallophosphoesterase (TIGR00282 family)